MTDQASLFEPAPASEVELEPRPVADLDGWGWDDWRRLWSEQARKGHPK